MSILMVVFILILVGVGLWLVNAYVPMDQKIKTIVNVLVIIVVVFWLIVKVIMPMIGEAGTVG